MNRATLFAGLLVIGSVLPGASIFASDLPQVKVSFADLDPATQEGARVLYRRLQLAARHVSGAEPEARDLAQHARWSESYDLALAKAVTDVGSVYGNLLYLQDATTRRSNPTKRAERLPALTHAGRL